MSRLARLLLLVVLAAAIAAPAGPGVADAPIAPGGPDLQTTLEKGLKARRPVEFDFIASVVEMVDNGTLPASIVQTSFLWARKKRPYPFPYFRQSLRIQAQQMGIDL